MLRTFTLVVAALGAVLALPGTLEAQVPKLGRDYYEDSVDIGFRVKAIKDWDFIPPSPNEPNLIGKYAPPNSQYIMLRGGAALFLNVWMVKFDRREEKGRGARDIDAWMSDRIDEGKGWRRAGDEEPEDLTKKVDLPATSYVYEGLSTNGTQGNEAQPIRALATVYKMGPDLDIAIIGIGPGDKKWGSYEKTYSSMAKSLRRVDIEALEVSGGSDPRSKKRASLQMDIAKAGGDWVLEETPNYFIVTSNHDRDFIEELKERLEAIRAVYEADYPADKARKVKKQKDEAGGDAEHEKPKEGEDEDEDEDSQDRSISAIDPMILSRTSVVRICRDRDEYFQYGGPGGSAGYWNWREEELVLYDDKASRGRDFTWGVLSHEAFHQYIFYFYGNLSPHSWYNEGTGDYYFGHDYKYKRFILSEAKNRKSDVQQMIREGNYAPLKDIVRWSQQEYYVGNPLGLGAGECYAQGWSIIYFLRTGEANKASGWQRAWGKILDKYLATLASTGDRDEAVDAAFAGVDWEALEKSWLDYTK